MKKETACLLLSIFLIGCTSIKEKNIENSKENIYNAIILDDIKTLTKSITDFPINHIDEDGDDLLKKATLSNSIKSIKILMDMGIERNNCDKQHRNSIFYVRSIEVLNFLIKNGVDINILDIEGTSVLNYFIQNKDIEYTKILLENGVFIDKKSLYSAVLSENLELLDKLVYCGADFLVVDNKGNYPVYYGNNEDIILRLLEIKGYDMNKKNNDGENILGEVYLKAVKFGNYKVIEKLLKMGVDKNYLSYGESAISIARNNNDYNMVTYLENKGL